MAGPRPTLIGLNDAADLLGVHRDTVRRMIASGALKAYRLPTGLIRLREADVLALARPIPAA